MRADGLGYASLWQPQECCVNIIDKPMVSQYLCALKVPIWFSLISPSSIISVQMKQTGHQESVKYRYLRSPVTKETLKNRDNLVSQN